MLRCLFALCCLILSASAADRFTCFGIGGGGRMFTPITNPHHPQTHYITCDMGTFYVSVDDGLSWTMTDMDAMRGCCSCRPGFHPHDADVVYMPYHCGKQHEFRISRDRGLSWGTLCSDVPWKEPNKMHSGFYTGPNAIIVSALEPERIFISTSEGLFRSDDGGKTFAAVTGVDGNIDHTFIANRRAPTGHLALAGGEHGVWRSLDGGMSWTKAGKGLPANRLWAFAATLGTDDTEATCFAAYDDVVYVSRDSGQTFALCSGLPKAAYRFLGTAQNDSAIAYVACGKNYSDNGKSTWGVWKTDNHGETWSKVFRPFAFEGQNIETSWVHLELNKSWGGAANGFGVCPTDAKRLIFTNAMEAYLSTDGGTSWAYRASAYAGESGAKPEAGHPWSGRGLEVALPTRVVFDPHQEQRRYLTYGDVGFLISTDSGSRWRKVAQGIPKEWISRMWSLIPDPEQKGVFYAACAANHGTLVEAGSEAKYSGGVLISTDSGESWTVMSKGLPTTEAPCNALALDPTSPVESRTLYCAYPSKGIYRSRDGGQTWTATAAVGRSNNRNINSLVCTADGTVYALVGGCRDAKWRFIYGDGGLWRSQDDGDSWVELTASTSLAFPVYFALDPHDSKRILISTTQAPGKEASGLWETRDDGSTWQQILKADDLGKIQHTYIHSGEVAIHPQHPGLIYYSTKTHGLWWSDDDGKTWQRMRGLPPASTAAIDFNPKEPDLIYVCSRGLWRGPLRGY